MNLSRSLSRVKVNYSWPFQQYQQLLSEGLCQCLTHYTNIMLDIAHCLANKWMVSNVTPYNDDSYNRRDV
jgi:hypothetical protein